MQRYNRGRYSSPQMYGHTTLGIPEKWERVLAYAGVWVTGLILLVIERNPVVRRHAKQSVVVFGTLSILGWLVSAFGGLLGHIWVIGFLFAVGFGAVGALIGVVTFIAWVGLMLMGYFSPNTLFVGSRRNRLF